MGLTGREQYRVLGRRGFGTGHQWPVTLQYADIELVPMRSRYQADWERVRRENASWLRPWEATLPPGAQPGPSSYGALVRALGHQAKDGGCCSG